MCFCAEASFASGAVLTSLGAYAQRRRANRSEVLLALVPILFGIQQCSEGIVWLSFTQPTLINSRDPSAFVFCMIATLWPVLIPAAFRAVEPNRKRQRLLAIALSAGILTSLFMLYHLFCSGSVAVIRDHSIWYEVEMPGKPVLRIAYLSVTTIAGLVSSWWTLRLLSILTFASFQLSMYAYETTYTSVWCFFAALISVLILVHVSRSTPTADQHLSFENLR